MNDELASGSSKTTRVAPASLSTHNSSIHRSPLTIVGASARAAAQSALRAGFAPIAGDLFGDVDLRRSCPTVQVSVYPEGLLDVCTGPQGGPWMYTGALENHPGLVRRMGQVRPLWGNSADTLSRVRDPFEVRRRFERAKIACPDVRPTSSSVPRNGSWLRKPLRSAAGMRIDIWDDAAPQAAEMASYFQKRIEGTPCAALFIGSAAGGALLGVTEQIVGADWAGGKGFGYCGSVGPLQLEQSVERQLEQIGMLLACDFGLRGLFGVDAVLEQGRVWPVEINPRYVASVEVLERALGIASVALHAAACTGSEVTYKSPITPSCIAGKAILYARADVRVPAELIEHIHERNRIAHWPMFADIPAVECRVPTGSPICTVLTSGESSAHVLSELRTMAGQCESWLTKRVNSPVRGQ